MWSSSRCFRLSFGLVWPFLGGELVCLGVTNLEVVAAAWRVSRSCQGLAQLLCTGVCYSGAEALSRENTTSRASSSSHVRKADGGARGEATLPSSVCWNLNDKLAVDIGALLERTVNLHCCFPFCLSLGPLNTGNSTELSTTLIAALLVQVDASSNDLCDC